MGFYNYYRILKELRYFFKDKTIKKLLTIIILSILTVCILHNKGYCAVDNYEVNIYPSIMITPVGVNGQNMEYISAPSGRVCFYVPIREGFIYQIHNPSSKELGFVFSNDIPAIGNKALFWGVSSQSLWYLTGGNDLDGYLCFWYTDGSSATDVYLTQKEGAIARNYVTAEDLQVQINSILSTLQTFDNYDNQRNATLIQSLHTDNMAILDAINNYLYGDVDDYPISFNNISGLIARLGHFENNQEYSTLYFPIFENKDYTINYSVRTQNPTSSQFRYGFTDNVPGINVDYATYNTWDTSQTSINFTATNNKYFYISYQTSGFSNFSVTSNYNPGQQAGIYGGLTDVNNQVVTQGQETRDTITNSNVDINENQLVSDNTQDITDNGYDNIFDMIKNAFTGTPQPITFPLTFLGNGQNLTLQPNFLSNHLQSGGLGMVVTIVNSYWYFVICRFIVKKIHEIIEALKEGELEHTTGNIKTEVF